MKINDFDENLVFCNEVDGKPVLFVRSCGCPCADVASNEDVLRRLHVVGLGRLLARRRQLLLELVVWSSNARIYTVESQSPLHTLYRVPNVLAHCIGCQTPVYTLDGLSILKITDFDDNSMFFRRIDEERQL